jgi:hypothetical protein
MHEISLPIPPIEPALSEERPFVIVHEQEDRERNGTFRPAASLKVLPALRTSGLLKALPAAEFKTLLCLLTFLSPNGEISPSLPEMATAMGVSEREMRDRMERLCAFSWQGKALIMCVARETALPAYTLVPDVLVAHEHMAYSEEATAPPMRAVSREVLIAQSRERYARPRAEVEQEIEQQFQRGTGLPEIDEDEALADLRRRLIAVGVANEQVSILFSRYDSQAIAQQLDWLPYRHANSPARYLFAAIQNDYQAPPSVRREPHFAEVAETTESPPDTVSTGI